MGRWGGRPSFRLHFPLKPTGASFWKCYEYIPSYLQSLFGTLHFPCPNSCNTLKQTVQPWKNQWLSKTFISLFWGLALLFPGFFFTHPINMSSSAHPAAKAPSAISFWVFRTFQKEGCLGITGATMTANFVSWSADSWPEGPIDWSEVSILIPRVSIEKTNEISDTTRISNGMECETAYVLYVIMSAAVFHVYICIYKYNMYR